MIETVIRENGTDGADGALWSPQAHMPTARAQRLGTTGSEGAWLTASTGQRLLDATASLCTRTWVRPGFPHPPGSRGQRWPGRRPRPRPQPRRPRPEP